MDPSEYSVVDECLDTFKLIPESLLGLMGGGLGTKAAAAGEGAKNIFLNLIKFIGSIILFICVLPALPFIFVMSVMFASLKYLFVKLRYL